MFAFKRTYEHFAPDKVVTMLQKRNQVFERVICADVLRAMQFGGAGLVFAGYLRTFTFPFAAYARRQRDAGRPARGPGRVSSFTYEAFTPVVYVL